MPFGEDFDDFTQCLEYDVNSTIFSWYGYWKCTTDGILWAAFWEVQERAVTAALYFFALNLLYWSQSNFYHPIMKESLWTTAFEMSLKFWICPEKWFGTMKKWCHFATAQWREQLSQLQHIWYLYAAGHPTIQKLGYPDQRYTGFAAGRFSPEKPSAAPSLSGTAKRGSPVQTAFAGADQRSCRSIPNRPPEFGEPLG